MTRGIVVRTGDGDERLDPRIERGVAQRVAATKTDPDAPEPLGIDAVDRAEEAGRVDEVGELAGAGFVLPRRAVTAAEFAVVERRRSHNRHAPGGPRTDRPLVL